MKTPRLKSFAGRSGQKNGFALVITISLMVLLSLLAVGLLSLSTVSLRASTQGNAMQEARSNARLGLMLAVGELQKQLGSDKRITAPASIADAAAPRHMSGVWDSAALSSETPSVDPSTQFRGFLGSGNEEDRTLLPGGNRVTLVGSGSLGSSAPQTDIVEAGTVGIAGASGSNTTGRFAWAGFDESTKSKINLVRTEPRNISNPSHALMGAAPRFGLEEISEFSGFDWFTSTEQERIVSLGSADRIDSLRDVVGARQHDFTVSSQGLLTDAARGGLKKDLSRMTESLPAGMATQRIYDDPDASRQTNNPYWGQLAEYANLYKESVAGAGGYGIQAQVPTGGGPAYNPRERAYNRPQTPRGMTLMPVVSRVQLQFSLISKDAHGGWGASTIRNTTGDPRRQYMLYMIYSPVVTLYNPYNVELELDEMRLEFEDVPIGFRFYINGQPQTTRLAHFNQLYLYHDNNSNTPKKFGLNLKSSYSQSTTSPIRLAPGESRIFGESVAGTSTFASGGIFDWQDNLTASVPLGPGYAPGMGFWVDWLTPDEMLTASDDQMGIISLRSTDTIDVEFAPMPSQASGNKLGIDISLVSRGRNTRAGRLELNYSNETTLTESMSQNKDADLLFPARLQRPYRTTEIYQRPTDQVKNFSRVKPFAIFSFEGKTTLDSATPSRPWVQNSQSSNMCVMNLRNEKLDQHTHEMRLIPWDPSMAIEHDPLTNRTYSHTSRSTLSGVQAAPMYEVPSLPLQSLAQLRHAQLAPQGFMGGSTYTVGESFATPLIPADTVTQRGSAGYTLIDHPWFANTTLWDSYYFSTIADQGGVAMGSNRQSSQIAQAFFNGEEQLLNPRYLPATNLAPDAAAAEVTSDEGYLTAAAHMVVDGPFNVNSTSVDAWVALLSSLNKETVEYYDGTGGARGNGQLDSVDKAENPFSRMRRPSGPPVESNAAGLGARESRWSGFHTLPTEQVRELAEQIVEEVRERGPFLSMADFVNRRPGSNTEEALKGALQAAIDRTSINASFSEDSENYGANDTRDSGFEFPEAMHGLNAVGAPGYLTQGDILSSLGQILTVRADTFRIRAYGESVDNNGDVKARAWCEAVVQRTVDYVDETDSAEDLPTTDANETFGRRFILTGFRWLAPEEV